MAKYNNPLPDKKEPTIFPKEESDDKLDYLPELEPEADEE